MNSTLIIKLMKNLIVNKFYNTLDEAVEKLDVYFAMNRIPEEQYSELVALAKNIYEPFVEDENIILEDVE